ncbi:hypothetical protein HPULCUR_001922 [Helicostylum pulchrum]|uniref:Phosphatidic acid phosphatase type 2/haloperoxidase domain-containing protein n=1 Tax=Helicostylum pulchrum TaxID=562976 RepID=A0ABP9XQM2_9FUNG
MAFKLKFNNSYRKRLFISYGRDWVLVVTMAIIFFAIDSIPPFHRQFSINDTSLMHTYAVHESVPVWLLMFIAILIPILTIVIYAGFFRKNWIDFHSGLLGLGLALTMTIMMTDVVKITVGRPRPDLFERCKPPPGIQDPPLHLLNYTICTADPYSYEMIDGFKSFPSGHSSFSFAGLGYMAFFLAGKMHVFDRGGHTYKSFVFSFPFLGAMLIAISRVRDYRHHWSDVFVGAIFGTLFAYFAYRQYYPSLESLDSHKPYPPRIKSPQDIFPDDDGRPNDVEQAITANDNLGYGDYTDRPSPSTSSTATRPHQQTKYATHHIENQADSSSPFHC